MREVVPPAVKLRVEVVEVAKRPRRKEGVAKILNLALDLSLLVPAGRGAGPGREVIVPGQLEQARVKLNRGPAPIEHGTAQVVIDQGSGHAAQGLEGRDMPPEEALERLVQREERDQRARVRQHHHKAGHGPDAVPDADLAKRAPVDLGLLTGERDDPAIDATEGLRPQPPHQPPDLHGGPRIAPLAEHLMEPRGAQAGILRERVADERQKRVEGTRAADAAPGAAGLVANRAAHRRVVDAEGGGDRPDRPVLAEIEAPDLGAPRGRDHRHSFGRCEGPPIVQGSATGWPDRRRHTASDLARGPVGHARHRVCREAWLEGKRDPSRAAARGRPADGHDDRVGLPGSGGGGSWPPAPSGGGRSRGSEASSTRGRGRTPDRWRTGDGSGGRSSGGAAGPRRRSPRGDLRLDGEPEPWHNRTDWLGLSELETVARVRRSSPGPHLASREPRTLPERPGRHYGGGCGR